MGSDLDNVLDNAIYLDATIVLSVAFRMIMACNSETCCIYSLSAGSYGGSSLTLFSI